jgi:hypothetical protein
MKGVMGQSPCFSPVFVFFFTWAGDRMPVMSSYVSESGRKTTYRKKNRYIVSFWYLKQMTCALFT